MKTITDAQRKIMDEYEANLIHLLNLPEKTHRDILNEDFNHGRPVPWKKHNLQNKRNFIVEELKRIQRWKSN
jgi:hypothetical protein